MGGDWLVEHLVGRAAALHARELAGPLRRTVSVFSVERSALVLGSTQPESHVDRSAVARAGVDVVRRRSGGGAVLVLPEVSLWVDVVVPRGDECWDDDVSRATWWLGEAWGAAVADLGVADATVHRGAVATSRWSPLVCFAGLGAGEVSVGGRKLVGISQRRNRAGARFQCLVQRHGDIGALLALLALDDGDRAQAGTDLTGVATGLDRRPAEVVDALVAHLPRR